MEPELSDDIHPTWEENAASGLCLRREAVEVPETPKKLFLRFQVRGRIGTAVGLLLNHRRALGSRLQFYTAGLACLATSRMSSKTSLTSGAIWSSGMESANTW
jgi:hypothetical protein